MDDAIRRKIAEASTRSWADPETRRRRMEGIQRAGKAKAERAEPLPLDERLKVSEGVRAAWRDPAVKERWVGAIQRGRAKQRRDARRDAIEAWADELEARLDEDDINPRDVLVAFLDEFYVAARRARQRAPRGQ